MFRSFIRPVAVALVAVGCGVSTASAGFTADSGTDVVDMLSYVPGVGNVFQIQAGTFSTYTPDTAPGGDLARFGYVIDAVGCWTNTGGSVTYEGTYEIFYNLDNNDTRDVGDLRISEGTIELDITLVDEIFGLALQVTAGKLTQVDGPENPAYADVKAAANYVALVGFVLIPTNPGTTGTADLSFMAIPEPASLALMAVGGAVAMLRRR